jgi:hypothetical protein
MKKIQAAKGSLQRRIFDFMIFSLRYNNPEIIDREPVLKKITG